MNKILVVDDDQNICDLLTLYLEKEGYTVVCANDGLEALEVYRDENPDLIILDIMLPGMDSKDVCKQIKRKDDVPILMLSAKAETFDKVYVWNWVPMIMLLNLSKQKNWLQELKHDCRTKGQSKRVFRFEVYRSCDK